MEYLGGDKLDFCHSKCRTFMCSFQELKVEKNVVKKCLWKPKQKCSVTLNSLLLADNRFPANQALSQKR